MIPKGKFWYWFILLVSVEMAIVYPAHLIIDHAGIFHHHHEGDHDHDDPFDDENCVFCVNMSPMESSGPEFIPTGGDKKRINATEKKRKDSYSGRYFSARAPPDTLSIH